VLANDPDDDMAISASGLITWAPLSAGFFQVLVNVTDGRGGKASKPIL
jgi:hypothetical protein